MAAPAGASARPQRTGAGAFAARPAPAVAPAALDDCLCALRFLNNNAKTYFIDTSPIVVSGESGDAVDGEPAEPGGTGAEGVAVDVCARGLARRVSRVLRHSLMEFNEYYCPSFVAC